MIKQGIQETKQCTLGIDQAPNNARSVRMIYRIGKTSILDLPIAIRYIISGIRFPILPNLADIVSGTSLPAFPGYDILLLSSSSRKIVAGIIDLSVATKCQLEA
jgi:hypothetical protein